MADMKVEGSRFGVPVFLYVLTHGLRASFIP